jgi:TRAP-type transport system periplasmic protein
MKAKFMRVGVLLMILSLILAGCGGSSAPKNSSTPAGGDKKVYDLKLSVHEPPTSTITKQYEAWAKLVEEKTQGQVKIKVFAGETLGKGKDAVTNVQQGVTDIAWCVIPFFPGQFPITEVLSLPMLGVDSSKTGGKSLVQLYKSNPDMQKEYANFKVLTFTTSGNQFISTNKKKVSALEDLKSLKIRVAGWGPSEMLKTVGGSPISIAPPEMYEATSKGVLDGFVFDWAGIQSSKLYEVTNYALITPFAAVPHAIVMNKQKWESLPPDLQKIIDELSGEALSELIAKGFDQDQAGIDNFKKLGKEVYTLAPEEQQKWEASAKQIWDRWVSDNKAKFNSEAVLKTLQENIAKNKGK